MEPEHIADGLYIHDSRILYFDAFSNMLNFGKFIKLSDCPANNLQENTIFHNLMYVLQLIESPELCRGRYWSADASIQLPEHINNIEGLFHGTPTVDFYGEFRKQLIEGASSAADRPVSYGELKKMYLQGNIPIQLVRGKWRKEGPRTIIYTYDNETLIRYNPPCWYSELPEGDPRIRDAAEVYAWAKEHPQEILSTKGRSLRDIIMGALSQPDEIRKTQQRIRVSRISRTSNN